MPSDGRSRPPRGGRTPTPESEAAIGGAPYLRHRRIQRSRSDPRPRILQLLATGGTGGAQESYTGLLLGLDRGRFEVRALSLSKGRAVTRLHRLGIAVDVIDEADDEAAVRQLATYLRRQEIDLVHAHMFRAEVVGTRAALAAGTPVIVATVHSSRVRSPRDVALLARLTPHIGRLIVPSRSIAAKVRAEGRQDARRDAAFAVIPNGIDLSRFDVPAPRCSLRRDFRVPHGALLIGVVARLEPEKGHAYLIEAMPSVLAEVPDAWLAIVGEGSQGAALRARAAALPAPARDRVLFAGRRDDVSAVTADLDVAVLPSLREAQGISILEAMARGTPVVASAVGGIPEVITDGVDGLLVPPADPAALATALVSLLTDADRRSRLAEAGRRTVAERFSIGAMVRQVESVYDEELERAGVLARVRAAGPRSRPRSAAAARPRDRAALEVPPA